MSILTVTLNPCIDRTIEIKGFSYGGLNSVSSSRSDPGGKGINVARVLQGSGEDVLCTGIIATDGKDFINEKLECEGIKTDFVKVPGRIRTNIKLFDSESHITTEINERGFPVCEKDTCDFVRLYEKQLSQADVVVVSGGAAEGISTNMYNRLIKEASEMGIKTVLDASGDFFRYGIEAAPFAVKPNIHELEEYIGAKLQSEGEVKKAAAELLKKGVSLVCVSMGAQGAVFATREGVIKTSPFEADIKSTVGAGDSMVAAIAFAIKKRLPFEKTARLATSAGTLTACLEGTDLCSLKDAEKVCGDIKLTKEG